MLRRPCQFAWKGDCDEISAIGKRLICKENFSPIVAICTERTITPEYAMRHTHATHALARETELTTVRDNLRHASISTTSIYLHGDEVKRARQMGEAFLARPS